MDAAVYGLVGSIITAVLALIGIVYQSRKNHDALLAAMDKHSELADARLEAKLDKAQAVTDTKLDNLAAEVRKHNNFAEKIPVLEEQMKVANHRISDLEKKQAV